MANELRANPGRWAIFSEDAHASTATSINFGRLKAFHPPKAFEAVTRKNPGGRYRIYVRFVGSAS